MNDTTSPFTRVTKTFLVLLRIAIGWHLFYEGLNKWDTYGTNQPWSAAEYLKRSEGPLGGFFRQLANGDLQSDEFNEQVIATQ